MIRNGKLIKKMAKSIVLEALLFLLSNGIKRWLNLKIS